jgi:hypothetical protein
VRTLALAFAVLCTPFASAFAQTTTSPSIQTAKPSDIQTAGGFLDVCGRPDLRVSKRNMESVGKASNAMEAIHDAMNAALADRTLCIGYLTGLIEGWQEGHDQGVLAAHFPAGVPRNESDPFHADLKSVSSNELQAMSAALKNDVPCLPDRLTNGETMDVVIKYIRDFSLKNPFLWQVFPTSRFVAPALRGAFPCPASATGTVAVTSVPDGADVNSDGSFVGNTPAMLKLSVGKHIVRVSKNGYKDWSREITVQDGSEVRLNANLEKR